MVPVRSPGALRMLRLREARIAAGLCSRCGQRPPRPGVNSCAECSSRAAGYVVDKRRQGLVLAWVKPGRSKT